MRTYALTALALLTVACGADSVPTAPSPPPPTSIAGNWVGTFTYTAISGAQRIVTAVTASFTQAQGNVTGQLNIEGGPRALVSGIVSTSAITASFQFVAPAPSTCNGTASVSGTVSATQVRITIPGLATTTGCTFFTNGDIVLTH